MFLIEKMEIFPSLQMNATLLTTSYQKSSRLRE